MVVGFLLVILKLRLEHLAVVVHVHHVRLLRLLSFGLLWTDHAVCGAVGERLHCGSRM